MDVLVTLALNILPLLLLFRLRQMRNCRTLIAQSLRLPLQDVPFASGKHPEFVAKYQAAMTNQLVWAANRVLNYAEREKSFSNFRRAIKEFRKFAKLQQAARAYGFQVDSSQPQDYSK